MTTTLEKVNGKDIQQVSNSPAELMGILAKNGYTPEQIMKMLDAQERYDGIQAKKAYNEAMSLVHEHIKIVAKTKKNTQTNSFYAELDNIICQTKDVYTKEGFSVSFYEGSGAAEGCVRVCVDVLHRQGHKETFFYDVPLDGVGIKGNANMTKIHAKASSVSYGRRYLLCMIFNIPTGDDNDGNNSKVVATIDEKQALTIDEYLIALNIDKAKFLKFFKVENVLDLPKDRYQEAIDMLKAREVKK